MKKQTNIDDEQPSLKRLRFTEPDLKVIVRYTKDDLKNGINNDRDSQDSDSKDSDSETDTHDDSDAEDGTSGQASSIEKIYKLYSVSLGKLSKVVEVSLCVDMKEKSTRSFTFEGVSPEMFEYALKIVEDPIASRNLKFKEALTLVPFYDKYAFASGLKLCDYVLEDFILKNVGINSLKQVPELDLVVDAISVAEQYQLWRSQKSSVDFLNSQFSAVFLYNGPCRFSAEQIKKLVPILQRNPSILNYVLDEGEVTEAEIASPLFAKFLVKSVACKIPGPQLKTIHLKESALYAGTYTIKFKYGRYGFWHESKDIILTQHASVFETVRDWEISKISPNGGTQLLWYFHRSKHFGYPPKFGWQSVHGDSNEIRLQYMSIFEK